MFISLYTGCSSIDGMIREDDRTWENKRKICSKLHSFEASLSRKSTLNFLPVVWVKQFSASALLWLHTILSNRNTTSLIDNCYHQRTECSITYVARTFKNRNLLITWLFQNILFAFISRLISSTRITNKLLRLILFVEIVRITVYSWSLIINI